MALGTPLVGTASSGTNGNPAPVLPSPIAAGDVGIIVIGWRGSTTTMTATGWTEETNSPWRNTTSNVEEIRVFKRVMDGTEDGSTVNFTKTGGGTGQTFVAQAYVIPGADNTTPINVQGTKASNASAQNIGAITGLTPTTAGSAVMVIGFKADDWTSVATLSGDGLTWSELGEPDSTSGNDAGLVVDWATGWTSGAITSKTFTVTGGAANTATGIMFAIQPAPTSVNCTGASTLPSLTQAATGTAPEAATGVSGLTGLTQAATGTAPEAATGASTLPALTQAATGGMSQINATGASSLPSLAQAASGTAPEAAAGASALTGLSQAATGTTRIAATGTSALTGLLQTATGTAPAAAVGASGLTGLTQAASATSPEAATGASVLPTLTQAATGTVAEAGAANGTGASVLPSLSQAAAATAPAAAAGASFLSLTQAAEADVLAAAAGASALTGLVQVAETDLIARGTATSALTALTQGASGALLIRADGTSLVPSLTQAASGIVTWTATANGASVLPALEQAAVGSVAGPMSAAAARKRWAAVSDRFWRVSPNPDDETLWARWLDNEL